MRYGLDIYIILPPAHTVYLCVLCGSENKQRLFPYTALTDWFCITKTECVYCAVRTGYLNVQHKLSEVCDSNSKIKPKLYELKLRICQ